MNPELSSFPFPWFFFIFILLLLLAALLLLFLRRERLCLLSFSLLFGLGFLYSLVLMPLSAPDEVAHYVGVYELSNVLIGKPEPMRDEEGRLLIRTEDVFLDDWPEDGDPDNATVIGMHLTGRSYGELFQRGIFSTGEKGYHFTLQEPVHTSFFAYLFPALGFSLARVLRMGGFGLVFFGRLFNLLLFSILTTLAVRRLPFGKEVLLSVALFPMVLELAGSLSYDAFILGLSFYLTAAVTDLATREQGPGLSDFLEIGILAFLLSPCKMVYSLLFLGCFSVPVRKWKNIGSYFLMIFGIAFLIALSLLLMNFQELSRYLHPSGGAVNYADAAATGSAAETYNLIGTLKTPVIFLKILRNSFQIKGEEYLLTMVGHPLGHFDQGLGAPIFLVGLFYLIVLLQGIFTRRGERGLSLLQRLCFLLTPALLVVTILASMLSAYTPKGTDYVLGVQGRYFLPALPMLLLSFFGGRSLWRAGGKAAAAPAAFSGKESKTSAGSSAPSRLSGNEKIEKAEKIEKIERGSGEGPKPAEAALFPPREAGEKKAEATPALTETETGESLPASDERKGKEAVSDKGKALASNEEKEKEEKEESFGKMRKGPEGGEKGTKDLKEKERAAPLPGQSRAFSGIFRRRERKSRKRKAGWGLSAPAPILLFLEFLLNAGLLLALLSIIAGRS